MQSATVYLKDAQAAGQFQGEDGVTILHDRVTFERVIDLTESPSGALKIVCNPQTHYINRSEWLTVDLQTRPLAAAGR